MINKKGSENPVKAQSMIPQTEYCRRCMCYRITHATIEAVQLGIVDAPQIIRLVSEYRQKIKEQNAHRIINQSGGHHAAIFENNPGVCPEGEVCRAG